MTELSLKVTLLLSAYGSVFGNADAKRCSKALFSSSEAAAEVETTPVLLAMLLKFVVAAVVSPKSYRAVVSWADCSAMVILLLPATS